MASAKKRFPLGMKNFHWENADGTVSILLTREQVAIIDRRDVDTVGSRRWYAHLTNGQWYAATKLARPGHELVNLGSSILRVSIGSEECVTYIDGDSLNCRRSNLRIAHRREVQQALRINKSSALPGVCWNHGCARWQCSAKIGGESVHLGVFTSELVAAAVYRVFCAEHDLPMVDATPDLIDLLRRAQVTHSQTSRRLRVK